VTVEYGKRGFLGAGTVERKTDPVLDPKFCDKEAAGRKTDPILDPKFSDDISDCITFDLSGVTSAALKLVVLSSRSSETNFNPCSKASTSESPKSFGFPFNRNLLPLPSFDIVLSIPLTSCIGKSKINPW